MKLTIEDAIRKRSELERAMLEKVRQFEAETGCSVHSINLTKHYVVGGYVNGDTTEIAICVRI